MTTAFLLTVLISVLALVLYIWTGVVVGRARIKYNVPAPQIQGPEEFNRLFRIQQNTLEQIVLFLAALWLAYGVCPTIWPAIAGVVWLIGRIIYGKAYARDPNARGAGFIIAILVSMGLLLTALIGVIIQFAEK